MNKVLTKKMASLLVLLLTVLSPISQSNVEVVQAETAYTVSNTITATLSNEGVLEITGTGNIPDYNQSAPAWKEDSYRIKRVVIGDGITGIGAVTFYGCYNLSEVTIPVSVKKIGDAAFAETNLSKINGATGVTEFGDYVFEGCAFTTFTFPDSTKKIGDYLFYECTNLEEIRIPTGVQNLGKIGYCATSLKHLSVDSNNKNFVVIDDVLYSADQKELLIYPSAKEDKNFTIPKTVRTISAYSFSFQKYLESIVVPEGVLSIEDGAFYHMSAIKTAEIPGSVKEVGLFVLEGCENLKSVKFNAQIEETPYRMCMDCSSLETVTFNSTTIKRLDNRAFMYCSGLKSVTLPENLETIGAAAFYGCSLLENMNYPKSLESIEEEAFTGTKVTAFPANLVKNSEGEYVSLGSVKYSGTYYYDKAYEVLKKVNEERKAKGLGSLTMDKDLMNAAMERSAEIALYFSHSRPDGADCFSACNKMSGENIALGQSDASAVMDTWMNSSGHRANILGVDYKSIGIGCFSQGGVIYWVQCFGTDATAKFTKPANKKVTLTKGIKVEYLMGSMFQFKNSSYSFKVGQKTALEIRLINSGAEYFVCELDPQSFIWKSSNPSVASVDSMGRVTGKKNGKFTITATLKSKPNSTIKYSGKVNGKAIELAKGTIKSLKNNFKKGVTLKINSIKNAKKYQLQYATNNKFKNRKSKTITRLTYKIKKLKKGKTYFVRVRGINGAQKGTWSRVKSVKIRK